MNLLNKRTAFSLFFFITGTLIAVELFEWSWIKSILITGLVFLIQYIADSFILENKRKPNKD